MARQPRRAFVANEHTERGVAVVKSLDVDPVVKAVPVVVLVPLTPAKPLEPDEEDDDEDEGEDDDVVKRYFVPILKAAGDEQTVTGVVLEPEKTDAQGDIYDAGVIRTAAHSFLADYNRETSLGFMHKEFNPPFDLCECYVAPQSLVINNVVVAEGAWVMTVRVNDPAKWAMVKEGKLTGFSIGGVAKVQKVTA